MNHRRWSLRSGTAVLVVFGLLATRCAGMNPDARKMLQEPMSGANPEADIQRSCATNVT